MKPQGYPGHSPVSETRQASLLELAADSVSDGIVAIDEESTIVFANPALAKIFGYLPAELAGQKLTLLMPETLKHAHRLSVRRYVTTGERRLSWKGVELPGLHKSGRQIPLEISFGEILQDGRHMFVGVVRDVTVRLRAEEALRVSEERYRSLSAASSEMVWATTATGEVVEDSPGWRAYTGQTWEECRGLGWMTALHPHDRSRVTEVWRQALKSRRAYEVQCRLRRQNESWGDVSIRGVPILEEDGLVREWVGTCTDISERKSAQAALEASERRYRELFALAPIGIYRSTREGRFVSVNTALARMLGYASPEDVLALDMRSDIYFDEGDRERLVAEIERLGGVAAFEVRWKRRDGAPIWVRLNARVVRAGTGNIDYETFVHDIDQRKRAEAALRRSEERFRRAFSVSPVAISLTEAKSGRIVDINEHFSRLLGYERDEMIGRTSLEMSLWVDPSDRERILSDVEASIPVREREIRLRTKTGEVRHIVGSVEPLEVGEERVLLSVFQDITERKRAEERLRTSEESYRLLFENNPFPMWVFEDDTLAFLAVNQAACRHYGYAREEFLSMTLRDIRVIETGPSLPPGSEPEPREYRQPGLWRHRKKDGTAIEVEITSNPILFGGCDARLVLAADVTERRQLENQLHQAQKMKAVGQLAGGIAHDFNNLLTVILGYGDVVRSQLPDDHPLRPEIDEIQKAGERAATLTRQLLAFSRRQVLLPRVLDVNEVVTDVEKMLRRLIGEDVDLRTVCDPTAARIKADPGQLEQVLVNLAVNARDAMPGGGILTIETGNIELDESPPEHAAMHPGSYVMLSVSDTGFGMDAETKARIFEPFFTTKEQGKGTGLGLATVYGIVKQSGGFIWVYSEPGHGTTFKIYLPRADGEMDAGRPLAQAPPENVRGAETILLLEDEEGVRRLTREVLEKQGYTVLEASGWQAARELVARHAGPIHLLLTDVVMPETGGPEAVSRLSDLRPGIKVLYMSGHTKNAVLHLEVVGAGLPFLPKPFTPRELARRVRQSLDAS
jgi:two-component system cell cycle sensor histidine kinase/response regulator CckA